MKNLYYHNKDYDILKNYHMTEALKLRQPKTSDSNIKISFKKRIFYSTMFKFDNLPLGEIVQKEKEPKSQLFQFFKNHKIK